MSLSLYCYYDEALENAEIDLFLGPFFKHMSWHLPSFVRVGQSDIPFSSAAHNLGIIFDSELALKEQVVKLCQLTCLEIDGSVQSDSIFPLKLQNSHFLSYFL